MHSQNAVIEQIKKAFNAFSFRGAIALFVIIGSFGFLYLLVFIGIPGANKEILYMSAGLMLGLDATIINWYFGSSKGKEDQEKIDQAKQLGTSEVYPMVPTTTTTTQPTTTTTTIAPTTTTTTADTTTTTTTVILAA